MDPKMPDDIEVARYALRTFSFHEGLNKFHSVAVPGDHWHGGVCMAQCFAMASPHIGVGVNYLEEELTPSNYHLAPNLACNCGIYGSLYLDHLQYQFGGQTRLIVAVIAAEGLTFVGSHGLRTAYARVVGYVIGRVDIADILTTAAKKQFAEAQQFDNVIDMIKAFNLPVFRGSIIDLRGGGNTHWWKTGEEIA